MKLRFLFVLALFLAQVASANIRIYRSSDIHSDYDKTEGYVKTTAALTQEFLAQDPKGTVVHLVNGDIAGMGDWTYHDRGGTTYKIFGDLAKDHRLIVNLGNHEAFDYRGQAGNDLFKKQVRDLIRIAKKTEKNANFKITTANLDLTWIGKRLFKPYEDLTSNTGAKLRVVGLVLDDFYKYSAYDPNAKYQAFRNVTSMLDVAKEQILQSRADGIDAVILMFHEEYQLVTQLTAQILEWKKSQPDLANLKIPVVVAAHDHLMKIVPVGETTVIDSGSNFQFSMIDLDDNLNLKEVRQFDTKDQAAFMNFSVLTKNEKKAIERAKKEKHLVLTDLAKIILGKTEGFSDTRVELKQGRRALGTKMAETLRDWAIQELSDQNILVKDVVAFWNSGTYRMNKAIPKGHITKLTTFQIYPSPFPSYIYVMKGAQVQRIFEALRRYGSSKNEFTPQTSANLTESETHQLPMLETGSDYALALDSWLGVNGFELPEIEEIFKNSRKIETKEINILDVLEKYLPKHLESEELEVATSKQDSDQCVLPLKK